MSEEIINKLKKYNKALTAMEINNILGLETVEEYQNLQQELNDLVSKGLLHKTRKDKYILMQYCSSLTVGTIHINKNGNGFVENAGTEDIFVARNNLNGAIDGDFVEVDIQDKEGIIVSILKRDLSTLVGEIVKKHDRLTFILDDKKKDIKIKLTSESLKRVVEGHKVLVKIIKELKPNLYLGEVTDVIGHKNDPGVDILSIAYKHGIYLNFPEEVKMQVANMPMEVSSIDIKGRRDLRNEEIFTIDGDDTKDIDDAISIKKMSDNYILGVHIADVSYYVKEGSPLFNIAYEKGTSSYLADTVLPMLPHELSNGICSLNENVDRLTISCVMTIDKNGKVLDKEIFPSVINSKKKMTYKNVNRIIMDGEVPSGYEPFVNSLNLMHELSQILRKARTNKGYIDFGLDEAKIVQDETGKAIDVIKRTQLEGEKLIEDFMIVANETVAGYITDMDLPFVYRVHGEPNPEKIQDFLNLIKMMGIRLNVNTNNITPKTMQEILNSLKDYKEFPILSDMLLRSMKKAIYSPLNIGHFGLASKIYTHFTSPIRRFPDLMVHTLLHHYLFDHQIDTETIKYYENYLITACDNASEREVEAIEAEREVLEMKMAEYMENYIGNEYEGIISGVTNFGFFVKLPNLVEGLVHVSTLNGFYNYVPELLSLVSESNIKYTLGDQVKVKLVAVSKENATIDFELVEDKHGNSK